MLRTYYSELTLLDGRGEGGGMGGGYVGQDSYGDSRGGPPDDRAPAGGSNFGGNADLDDEITF